MIAAAVIGSLICGLLLVIAVGCTCKLYAVRFNYNQHSSNNNTSAITEIQWATRARRSAPPLYDDAMRTSRPFDEVAAEVRNLLQASTDPLQSLQVDRVTPGEGDVPMIQGHDVGIFGGCEDGGDMAVVDVADDDTLLDISQDGSADSQFELANYESTGRSRLTVRSRLSRWGINVKQFLGIAPQQNSRRSNH